MAWLTNWSYRRPVTITNSGSALTDYQVFVTLDTQSLISAGKMRSDGGDIRFTDSDGSTLLNYWIESGINTTSTKIWVKVPSIPSGNKTIYVYYCNSSATSASNPYNTLEFYDDFSTDPSGRWTVLSGTWSWNSAEGTYSQTSSGGPHVVVAGNVISNGVLEADCMGMVYNADWGIVFRASNLSNFYSWQYFNGSLGFVKYVNGTRGEYYLKSIGETLNTWQKFKVIFHSSTLQFYFNETLIGTRTDTDLTSGKIGLFSWDTTKFDNVKLRKYSFPEPTTSVGAEENPFFTSFLISPNIAGSKITTQSSTSFLLNFSVSNKITTALSSLIQFLTNTNVKREIPKQLIKNIKTEEINFDITNQP